MKTGAPPVLRPDRGWVHLGPRCTRREVRALGLLKAAERLLHDGFRPSGDAYFASATTRSSVATKETNEWPRSYAGEGSASSSSSTRGAG